jgi:hypothetical protein
LLVKWEVERAKRPHGVAWLLTIALSAALAYVAMLGPVL